MSKKRDNMFSKISLTILLASAMFALAAIPALADTANFTFDGTLSGDFRYVLSDTIGTTVLTDSVTIPGSGTDYIRSPNASFYSKVFDSGNAVASGTWTVYLFVYASGTNSIKASVEIGEYTSGGVYNAWMTPANFGWSANLATSSPSSPVSVTYNDLGTHTLAAGSRLYLRVYGQNLKSSSRTLYLDYDHSTKTSRVATPAFAQPIPSLGWYLIAVLVTLFIVVAARRGVFRIARTKGQPV